MERLRESEKQEDAQMPKVSKISDFVNKYATEWAYEISYKPIEYGKGINYRGDKIIRESELMPGRINGIDYPLACPKDIFVHNHVGSGPFYSPLNFKDIDMALKIGVKKIFASTIEDFSAMDFTTVPKSLSKNSLRIWVDSANKETDDLMKKLNFDKMNELEDIFEIMRNNPKLNSYLIEKLKDFAKFSGAIFENIKWIDYK